MLESGYVEVRCERCQSSFAPGTKQCVHCGGALGRRMIAFDTLSGAHRARSSPHELPGAQPDAQPDIGRLIRFALIGLGILAAIARVILGER
jgi:hypothetical protein